MLITVVLPIKLRTYFLEPKLPLNQYHFYKNLFMLSLPADVLWGSFYAKLKKSRFLCAGFYCILVSTPPEIKVSCLWGPFLSSQSMLVFFIPEVLMEQYWLMIYPRLIFRKIICSRNRVTIDVIRKGKWLKVDKSCRSPRSLRFPARKVRRMQDSGRC